MNEQKIQFANRQGKTGWRRRCCHGDTALRIEQRGIQNSVRPCRKTAFRYCDAVQQKQQWAAFGFLATHERKARLDFFGCVEQGESRTHRPRSDRANRTGTITEPRKLVWINLAGTGQCQSPGNTPPGMAQGRLCTMETGYCEEGKAKPTTTEKNYIVLSVQRINSPLYISVQRTNRKARISVHRTYRGHFSGFPISVHRTPSSITTTYRETETGWKRGGKP